MQFSISWTKSKYSKFKLSLQSKAGLQNIILQSSGVPPSYKLSLTDGLYKIEIKLFTGSASTISSKFSSSILYLRHPRQDLSSNTWHKRGGGHDKFFFRSSLETCSTGTVTWTLVTAGPNPTLLYALMTKRRIESSVYKRYVDSERYIKPWRFNYLNVR